MATMKMPCAVGSGGLTPTTLWSNTSPTSDFPASDTTITVTLSDDIDNYEYIKIKARRSKSDATEYAIIYSVEDFKKLNNANGASAGALAYNYNSSNSARVFYYTSNTSVTFELAKALNSTGTARTGAIPLEIIGLK